MSRARSAAPCGRTVTLNVCVNSCVLPTDERLGTTFAFFWNRSPLEPVSRQLGFPATNPSGTTSAKPVPLDGGVPSRESMSECKKAFEDCQKACTP